MFLIISIVVLIVRIFDWVNQKYEINKNQKIILKELKYLNAEEKYLLNLFIINNSRSIVNDPDYNQAAISLSEKRILENQIIDIRAPLTIEKFIWDEIIKDDKFQIS